MFATLSGIQIFLLCYGVFMLVFILLWGRWQDRMHDMDEAMAKAFEEEHQHRIVSAGVRPYPE